jgi:putative membrane protein
MNDLIKPDISTELAQERTILAFERSRQACDRTMMATLRTSFSMIGFGFTLFAFFRSLRSDELLGTSAVPDGSPARFGLALVTLGILVLSHGLWAETRFRRMLDKRRHDLEVRGVLPPQGPMPLPAIRAAGTLLLMLALLAVLAIAARIGPFA